jgi:putative phosphoesterase
MSTKGPHKKISTVGIISDTHGLLRPVAAAALEDSDLIIHAGDIGNPHIIEGLELIAPVVAVRGNMDNDGWACSLKRSEVVEIHGHELYVLHDVNRIDLDPAAAHIRAIIYGHSHRPAIQEHEGILYINPGSAGPRRFKLPVSVAVLHISGNNLSAEIIELKV